MLNNPGFTILIIDDDEKLCHLIEDTLLETNLFSNIVIANDGSEGLSKIKNQQFSIIILDNCMPKQSGLQVIQHLSNNSKYKDIEIIFMSGQLDSDEVRNALKRGVKHILVKPFDDQKLLNMIHQILETAKKTL